MALTIAYSGPVGSPIKTAHLFFNSPASTGSKPSLPTSAISPAFLPASSPATGMMGLTRIVGRLGHIAATAVHSSPEISSHVARREDVKAITFWRNSSRGVPGDQFLLVAAIGLWVIDGDPISTVGPAVEDAGLRRGAF
jgi:hypothetical protein